MTALMCPSLHRLGLLLRTAYRLRDDSIAGKRDGKVLAQAERNLLRVHVLIFRHRLSCPYCKFNDSLRAGPDNRGN
jgi:hypothetical protein